MESLFWIVPLLLVVWFFKSRGVRSKEAKMAAANGALVVDVRTPQEFSGRHYPGALNIPVDQVQARLSEFGDKNSPIVVYCQSGGRSGMAKQILEAAGFTKVTNGGGVADMMR